MFFKITVYDAGKRPRGEAKMGLNWKQKTWSIFEDTQSVWQKVGFSRQGSFVVKSWGVIWVMDQGHNTVILWDAPMGDSDIKHVHLPGEGRIFDPSNAAFKEGKVRWTLDTAAQKPTLNALRKRAQEKLSGVIPAPYGSTNWKNNPFHSLQENAKAGYTNCVEFPAYVGYLLGDEKFPRGYPPVSTRGWKDAGNKQRPLPGDVFILCKTATRDGTTAHVGVVYDPNWENSDGLLWRTADWGQGNSSWDGAWVVRTYDPEAETLTGGRDGGPHPEPRAIKGWVDLDAYFGAKG